MFSISLSSFPVVRNFRVSINGWQSKVFVYSLATSWVGRAADYSPKYSRISPRKPAKSSCFIRLHLPHQWYALLLILIRGSGARRWRHTKWRRRLNETAQKQQEDWRIVVVGCCRCCYCFLVVDNALFMTDYSGDDTRRFRDDMAACFNPPSVMIWNFHMRYANCSRSGITVGRDTSRLHCRLFRRQLKGHLFPGSMNAALCDFWYGAP